MYNIRIEINSPFQSEPLASLLQDKKELVWVYPSAKYPFDHDQWKEWFKQEGNPISLLFYEGKRAIGHAALITREEKLFICFVFLITEMRGHGKGKELLNLTESYVRKNFSVSRIYLHVVPENEAAIHFYLRAGYLHDGKKDTWLRLSKEIALS
jgi:RimJ/RimL family protein N-acetyltransferase